MSKRSIEAEFESKESAETFKNYLGSELKKRKHLRDQAFQFSKLGLPVPDAELSGWEFDAGPWMQKVQQLGLRKPSVISGPNATEYRKANGTIEVYVKDVDEFEKDANTAIRPKMRSWYVYDEDIPWVPLREKSNAVAKLIEGGNLRLKAYKTLLDTKGIDSKLEEGFGKRSKLVIPIKEFEPETLHGIKMCAAEYGEAKLSVPVYQTGWRPTSEMKHVDTIKAYVSVFGVRDKVKFDGEVYKTGYEVEAGVRGWRGAVKSLYADAGTKAKELGSTKYEVRKMKTK